MEHSVGDQVFVLAFGLGGTLLSLASWMGWWRGWMNLPTGRLPLTILPGGVGFSLIGISSMLPQQGPLGVLGGALVILGILFALICGLSLLTMPTWVQSRWFISWMARRYPERTRGNE